MAIRNKTLIELVKQEAKNLRKHSTEGELNRLNSRHLRSTSSGDCIYGQMTRCCNSGRAQELIHKCAIRTYRVDKNRDSIFQGLKLNGPPDENAGRERSDYFGDDINYLSPIEVFININEKEEKHENNAILIDYLQGKTKRLNFK